MTPTATAFFSRLAELLAGTLSTECAGKSLELNAASALAVDWIFGLHRSGKVLLDGNGGSAAIVSHMEVDLLNRGQTLGTWAFENTPFPVFPPRRPRSEPQPRPTTRNRPCPPHPRSSR